MNFTKKIWDLILKFYTKKYIFIKDLNNFTKQPSSLMPGIFWKKKNFRKINKKKKLKIKSLLKIKLHNGKIYSYRSVRNYKIPLLYYTQPITYGKKKEKKKLHSWVCLLKSFLQKCASLFLIFLIGLNVFEKGIRFRVPLGIPIWLYNHNRTSF